MQRGRERCYLIYDSVYLHNALIDERQALVEVIDREIGIGDIGFGIVNITDDLGGSVLYAVNILEDIVGVLLRFLYGIARFYGEVSYLAGNDRETLAVLPGAGGFYRRVYRENIRLLGYTLYFVKNPLVFFYADADLADKVGDVARAGLDAVDVGGQRAHIVLDARVLLGIFLGGGTDRLDLLGEHRHRIVDIRNSVGKLLVLLPDPTGEHFHLMLFIRNTVVRGVVSVENGYSHIAAGLKSAGMAVDSSFQLGEFLHALEYSVELCFRRADYSAPVHVCSHKVFKPQRLEDLLVETCGRVAVLCPCPRVCKNIIRVKGVNGVFGARARVAAELAS